MDIEQGKPLMGSRRGRLRTQPVKPGPVGILCRVYVHRGNSSVWAIAFKQDATGQPKPHRAVGPLNPVQAQHATPAELNFQSNGIDARHFDMSHYLPAGKEFWMSYGPRVPRRLAAKRGQGQRGRLRIHDLNQRGH